MDKIVDPDTASEILELMKKPAERSRMSLQDAVKLIVNGNLSIYAYKISRKIALKYGHDLYPTYKEVCNALNDSSSQRCFVCNATIGKFNDIDNMIERNIKSDSLKYGFLILHPNIRFMELVLHISYRLSLEVPVWRVSKVFEAVTNEKKKEIQDQLKSELSILVDAPTQGSGNTNNGNTASKFFNNTDVVARITGFNEHLLYRFKVILAVISSNCLVNNAAFGAYCKETAFKYVEFYNWYKIPTLMHVILIHGHVITKELIVPIGILSEDAQESNHKMIKRFRDRFSRKVSRVATNTDMCCRLFVNSDPYLSLLDIEENKKKKLNDSGDEKSVIRLYRVSR
ncbi:uncharacterized protein LOC116417026 [Nasonia vitripennis]|uniref:Uncharacterized protein n=1 Tax=Nasonia vitripennis TaxID=7425 RepID=A0A7M7QBH5_NASVI|nr:uncharacterized protein LOC116417026 [Nasonia vitripennis]